MSEEFNQSDHYDLIYTELCEDGVYKDVSLSLIIWPSEQQALTDWLIAESEKKNVLLYDQTDMLTRFDLVELPGRSIQKLLASNHLTLMHDCPTDQIDPNEWFKKIAPLLTYAGTGSAIYFTVRREPSTIPYLYRFFLKEGVWRLQLAEVKYHDCP